MVCRRPAPVVALGQLLDAEAGTLRPAAESAVLGEQHPGVGQVAARDAEEAGEVLRCLLTGQLAQLKQGDRVLAARKAQHSDAIVVEDHEGPGAAPAAVGVHAAASPASPASGRAADA